jgi:branched-chain amino acid transport system substrate-binding protein
MLKTLKSVALAGTMLATAVATASAADINVGSAAGVTGPIAEFVIPIVEARNLAAQHVNEQGGLLDGDTMVLVLGDSQCDPKAGVDAGTKLVNVDQVVAIVGASCSGATNGMVQSVTIPAGVVNVSDSATAPSIADIEDNDLVFRVAASDAYQGVAVAQVAINAGYTRVAMTYANDDYNAGIAAVFEQAFADMGGTITASAMHEPNKASYRSELATLAGGDAQALAVFAYYGGSGIAILRNSLENELFDQFVGAEGMLEQSVIDSIGADALRDRIGLTQTSSDVEAPSYIAFADAFTAAGHDPAAPYSTHGYDATFLLALAIEKAGAADRSLISAALREVANAPGEIIRPGEWAKAKALIAAGTDINYEGATGANEFDERGEVAGTFGVNTVSADGTWELNPIAE